MYRRTSVLDAVLGWAGYGLGYSEDDTPPVADPLARRSESMEASVPVETSLPDEVPVRVLDRPPIRKEEPTRVATTPAEPEASAGTNHESDLHWTDLITTSTDRRLQVWHELENGLVDRWDLWKNKRLDSIARRRQSWTDQLDEYASDFEAITGRQRARWQLLRGAWRARWSAWTARRAEAPAAREPWHEGGLSIIQRDRNWKVMQRVSLDERERAAADGQPAINDRSEEPDTSPVFDDPWSIADTAPVDTQLIDEQMDAQQRREDTRDEVPIPAVQRLQRMLDAKTPGADPTGDDDPLN